MGRTARKKVGINDAGVVVTDDVDVLDFEGAGQSTALLAGPNKTVQETIPGAITPSTKYTSTPTYDGQGRITRVDYANGDYKTISYTGTSWLPHIKVTVYGGVTKTYTYSFSGSVWQGTIVS